MDELVTSIRTVDRRTHVEVSIWVNHALTGTLTMRPEEARRFRALVGRAERAEKALMRCAEMHCVSPFEVTDAGRSVGWRDCGKCPTCNARSALAASPREEGSGSLKVIRQLAYRGKEGCTSALCTRIGFTGQCYGWHCAQCDEPCSSQGHENCVVAAEDDADRAAWLEAELGDAPGEEGNGG